MGHPNSTVLFHLLNFSLLSNKNQFCSSHLHFDCPTCKLSKSKILPFLVAGSHAKNCFDVIHSDVWGITPIISHAQYKYFVTFIDYYSRFTCIYFLRSKSKVLSICKTFFTYVETQLSATIKVLRFVSILVESIYLMPFTILYKIRVFFSNVLVLFHFIKMVLLNKRIVIFLMLTRTLLLESSVPSKFWIEALSTAIYLINRLPSQTLHYESPYFHLYQKHHHLHIFGCVCFVHLPPHECYKLSAQFVKCAFMDYSMSHN